jgi:hypothetical protein
MYIFHCRDSPNQYQCDNQRARIIPRVLPPPLSEGMLGCAKKSREKVVRKSARKDKEMSN